MKSKFKNIVIFSKRNTPNRSQTFYTLIEYLKSKKVNIYLEHDTAIMFKGCNLPVVKLQEMKKKCDLMIVIGGDGSLLNAAHIAASQNLPILGINRGNLGFLTDIKPNNIGKIGEILDGQYFEEHRFLLKASSIKTGNKRDTSDNLGLNEIAIFSSMTGSMIEFAVSVDKQYLCNYRSDGLIIATPTGSTAHSLSSGGPILYPTLENIVLVPVLSHNLSSRPIVINSNSKIKITFNKTNKVDLTLLCDGHPNKIVNKDTIEITKAKEKLHLLHPKDYNYFETLRTKLNWEKGNINP